MWNRRGSRTPIYGAIPLPTRVSAVSFGPTFVSYLECEIM